MLLLSLACDRVKYGEMPRCLPVLGEVPDVYCQPREESHCIETSEPEALCQRKRSPELSQARPQKELLTHNMSILTREQFPTQKGAL